MIAPPPVPGAIDFSQCRKLRPSPMFRWLRTSRSSVWIDEQRVTILTQSVVNEHCRQLALREILGITILRSRGRQIGNICMGLAAFVAVMLGLLSLDPGQTVGLIAAAIIAAILLGFVLINSLLGETCRCYLRTAVQNAPVTAVTRLPHARQLASQLTEAVRIAQAGTLATLETIDQSADTTPEETAP